MIFTRVNGLAALPQETLPLQQMKVLRVGLNAAFLVARRDILADDRDLSRRLRRNGSQLCPGILYEKKTEPSRITLVPSNVVMRVI